MQLSKAHQLGGALSGCVGLRVDRAEKLPIYARHGVAHAWLVDPDQRMLEVFENHDGKWLLLTVLDNDVGVSPPPFDAITFPLGSLWAD